jgi:uncharacterized damage-inducible protein DinB
MEQNLGSTLALLAATPATLDALLAGLPEALDNANEGEGTWSVVQVVAHIFRGERTDWLPRVRMILRVGESEAFAAFDREAHLTDGRSLSVLLTEFAELRAANLKALRELELTPEDLERCGTHPAFGRVTLSQLLATWAVHDLSHLHQVSRILASQYREAVGPWSRYLGVLHCDGHSGKG